MIDRAKIDEWRMFLDSFLKKRGTFGVGKSFDEGERLIQEFVKFANPSGRTLEIGCGSGVIGRYLGSGYYYGIDPVVESAMEFPIVQGVGEFLPFKDGTFERVLVAETLDHCLDHELVIKESDRVLSGDGRLAILQNVVRSDPKYKIERLLSYVRTRDFKSLARSLRENILLLIGARKKTNIEYGHTTYFTEKSLIAAIEGSMNVIERELHNQVIFVLAGK